jgi:hypothetical protein
MVTGLFLAKYHLRSLKSFYKGAFNVDSTLACEGACSATVVAGGAKAATVVSEILVSHPGCTPRTDDQYR